MGFSSKEVRRQEVYSAAKAVTKSYNTPSSSKLNVAPVSDDKRTTSNSKGRP